MGVRSAVLLAAVFIGVVALYLETRDQWNWTKLMRLLLSLRNVDERVVGAWVQQLLPDIGAQPVEMKLVDITGS